MKPRSCISNPVADWLAGEGRIGRVTFSQTGKTLRYRGGSFRTLNGRGYKANYYEVADRAVVLDFRSAA